MKNRSRDISKYIRGVKMASLQLRCFEFIKNFVFFLGLLEIPKKIELSTGSFVIVWNIVQNYSFFKSSPLRTVSPVLILLLPGNFFQKCDFQRGSKICDILLGGLRFVTVCDKRRRSKIIKNSVTYFMDGPYKRFRGKLRNTKKSNIINRLLQWIKIIKIL